MDTAAFHGHLDCLQWLHLAGYACTVRAMDDAAINDHQQVVAWLHENREEGCSTDAMDYAAVHGHLHILQWLHEHRFERSEEHTSELQSLMRISYAVFCLKNKKKNRTQYN